MLGTKGAVAVAAMLVLAVFASTPVVAAASVTVVTDSATDVTDSSATVHGELTELNDTDSANVSFEYWVEGDEANSTTTASQTLSATGAFNVTLTGLANDTTYAYVVHAETENASDTGALKTFTTLDHAPLGVETREATDVTNGSATLNGELTGLAGEPNGTVWFEYWVEGDRANNTTTADDVLDAPGSFDASVDGLDDNTTYVYVAHASANGSTVSGDEVTFATGDGADDEDAWDGEGPFGRWVSTLVEKFKTLDADGPLGQLVSEMVTKNNPGAEHRSDEANPGGNGNGPPAHAGPGSDDEGGNGGPPEHAKANKDKGKQKADGSSGDDGDVAELDVTVDGDVANGSTVTVTVTDADGNAVEGATVSVNEDEVGATDANGTVDVTLPDPLGDEVEITAATDDAEGSWEWEAEADG